MIDHVRTLLVEKAQANKMVKMEVNFICLRHSPYLYCSPESEEHLINICRVLQGEGIHFKIIE